MGSGTTVEWQWAAISLQARRQSTHRRAKDSNPIHLSGLLIDDFRLRDGVVHFKDDVPAGGFATTAQEINIDLQKFALDTDRSNPVQALTGNQA